MSTLKPCPFCGNKVKIESVHFEDYASSSFDNTYLRIACRNCNFDMKVYPKGLGCTQEEKDYLIKRWNNRKGSGRHQKPPTTAF